MLVQKSRESKHRSRWGTEWHRSRLCRHAFFITFEREREPVNRRGSPRSHRLRNRRVALETTVDFNSHDRQSDRHHCHVRFPVGTNAFGCYGWQQYPVAAAILVGTLQVQVSQNHHNVKCLSFKSFVENQPLCFSWNQALDITTSRSF